MYHSKGGNRRRSYGMTDRNEHDAYAAFQEGTRLLEGDNAHAAVIALEHARELEPEKGSVREALARAYFAALAPAAAAMPSCWPVPPLAPIAPMILPLTTIGTPPSDATGFSGKVVNALLPAAY